MCELFTAYDDSGDEIYSRVIITKRVFFWLHKIEVYTTDSKSTHSTSTFTAQRLTKGTI